MQRLSGKVSLVTGSSSGIGRAIALKFGKEGSQVVVSARREDLLEETASLIRASGGLATAIPADISDEKQAQEMIQQTVDRFGRIDILVNNAGTGGGGRIEDVSTEEYDRVMDINLRGTFFCCREGFHHMKAQNGGHIINISSVAGVQAWEGTGIYSASKHGIMALTKSLACEGREYGIKASAICPGGVAQDLVDAPADVILQSGKIDPFDIAETAVYLASLGPNTVVHQIVVDRIGADW